MPTKNKKVAIIVSILLIAGSLGYLAFGNFGENIVYFVTPSEVKAFTPEAFAKKVRPGSILAEIHTTDLPSGNLSRNNDDSELNYPETN